MDKCDATAWYDAFLDGRTCCVQGVINPILAFFHFDLGRATNFDHRNTARQFG